MSYAHDYYLGKGRKATTCSKKKKAKACIQHYVWHSKGVQSGGENTFWLAVVVQF